MYTAYFNETWPEHFKRLDDSIKERVTKKIKKILEHPDKRHLMRSAFFVDEIGQFRIVYMVFEEANAVVFYFIGTHKQYERLYRQEF